MWEIWDETMENEQENTRISLEFGHFSERFFWIYETEKVLFMARTNEISSRKSSEIDS